MNIENVYEELCGRLEDESIVLTGEESCLEGMLAPFMDELKLERLDVSGAKIGRESGSVILHGVWDGADVFPGIDSFLKLVLEAKKEGRIHCTLKLEVNAEWIRMERLFGKLPYSWTQVNGKLQKQRCVFSDMQLRQPVFTLDSHEWEDEGRNIALECQVRLNVEAGQLALSKENKWTSSWSDYLDFFPGKGSMKGRLRYLGAEESGTFCRFDLDAEIGLKQGIPFSYLLDSDALFAAPYAGGSAAIRLLSADVDPYPVTDALTGKAADAAAMPVSSVTLLCRLLLSASGKVIEASLPLFTDGDHWGICFSSEKPVTGLDLLNVLKSYFLLSDSQKLEVPEGLPVLDSFGLTGLRVGTAPDRNGRFAISDITIRAKSSKPWNTFLQGCVIDEVGIVWEYYWCLKPKFRSLCAAIITGTVFGEASWKLADKLTLKVRAAATFPQLRLSAEAILEETVSLDELAEGLSMKTTGQTGLTLASLTAEVWPDTHATRFAAKITPGQRWSISVGSASFALTSLAAYLTMEEGQRIFEVIGEAAVSPPGAQDFTIGARALIDSRGFLIEGGLKAGTVDLAALLAGIFGVSVSKDSLFQIKLTEFYLLFEEWEKKILVSAALSAAWDTKILGQDLSLTGRVCVEGTPDHMSASLQLEFAVGLFLISATLKDVLADKFQYRFRLQFGGVYLDADHTVVKQAEGSKEVEHELLSVSLGGITLGEIAAKAAALVNPNREYILEKPWDILNRIELSRFSFTYDVTDRSFRFLYRVDLNIPGLMNLRAVGMEYDKRAGGNLRFLCYGSFLGTDYEEAPLGWEVYDGAPEVPGQGDQAFSLSFLGLARHLGETREYGSVEEAVTALKERMSAASPRQEILYDATAEWLFAVDMLIAGQIKFQLVLMDPKLYGGRLEILKGSEGSALTPFAGLTVDLLYQKLACGIGCFQLLFLPPENLRDFNLGYLSLGLGKILIQIYTNGDFYLDMGFPEDGDFSNSFLVRAGEYTGRGGICFGAMTGKTSKDVPGITNGTFSPVIILGVGLSLSFGGSFDFGIVKGELSLCLIGIFRGVFAQYHPYDGGDADTYYKVTARAGVTGRMYLCADLKLIAVEAEVKVEAFADLTLEAYEPYVVELTLDLRLSASIKILFIKISFSFSFHFHTSFVIGTKGSPPWIEEGSNRKKGSLSVRERSLLEGGREKIRTERFMKTMRQQKKEAPLTVKLHLVPVFSLENMQVELSEMPAACQEERKPCAAWILSLESAKEFQSLVNILMELLVSCLEADSGFYTYDQINAVSGLWEQKKKQGGLYEELTAFFVKDQVNFVIESEKQEKSAEQVVDGIYFPMFPAVRLEWKADGRLETAVDFSAYTMVGTDYVDALLKWFSERRPVNGKEKTEREKWSKLWPDEMMSFSTFLFEDYFRMLLDFIVGEMNREFECCTLSGKDWSLRELAGQFYEGADPADILYSNPKLCAAADYTVTIPVLEARAGKGDTLQSLCTRYGGSAPDMLEGAMDSLRLLKEEFTMDYCYMFENHQSFTKAETAALFYIRLYEDTFAAAGDLSEWKERLSEKNSLTAEQWEALHQGTRLILPLSGGEKEYTAYFGDSLSTVAGYVALLELFAAGKAPDAFQNFLDSLEEEAPGYRIRLQVTLHAKETIEEEAKRLYPEQGKLFSGCGLLDADCLRTDAKVLLHDAAISWKAMETAWDVMAREPVTLLDLAKSCEERRAFFAGEICLGRPDRIPKERFERDVLSENIVNQAAGMVSRFYLQGLRIPQAEERTGKLKRSAGSGLKGLFQLSGQQMSISVREGTVYRLELMAEGAESYLHFAEGGLLSREFTSNELLAMLPDSRMHFYIKSPLEALPYVKEQSKTYVPKRSIPVRSKENPGRLLLFDEEWRKDSAGHFSDYTLAGQEPLEGSFVCCFQIQLKQIENQPGHCFGVTVPKDHSLCYQAWQAAGGGDLARVLLGYMPSAVMGAEEDLTLLDSKKTLLMKTNLSAVTRHTSVSGKMKYEYTAAPEDMKNFFRLLWEGAVTGGEGYYLYVEEDDKAGIPAGAMDEQGAVDLWVLAVFKEGQGTANGYWIYRAAGEADGWYLTDNRLDGKKDCYAALPVGKSGFRMELLEAQDVCSALWKVDKTQYARELFSILSYSTKEDEPGLPILPHSPTAEGGEEEKGVLAYEVVIPVDRLLGYEENPYGAVGKSIYATLELRDILGNRANFSGSVPGLTLMPLYQEAITGIGSFPSTRVFYEIVPDERKGALLRVTLEAPEDVETKNADTANASDAEKAAKVIRDQYACEDVSVSIFCSLTDVRYEVDKEDILVYLERLTAKERGFSTIWEYPLSITAQEEILRLEVSVCTTRERVLCAKDGSIAKVEAAVLPLGEKEKGAVSERFINKLEDAFLDYRAASDEEGELWLIYCGAEGQPMLQLPPPGCEEPSFYSFAPLCTRLLTRSSQGKQYADVDLELWAVQLLKDLDAILEGACACRAALICRDSLEAVMEGKKSLAESILGQLASVEEEEHGNLEAARAYMRNQLGASLSKGYQTQILAQFRSEGHYNLPLPARAEGFVSLNGKSLSGAAKAGLTEDGYFHFLVPDEQPETSEGKKGEAETVFAYEIHQVEHKIQPMPRGENPLAAAFLSGQYESSSWLTLFHPMEDGNWPDGYRISMRYRGGVNAPLRQYPHIPVLKSQEAVFSQPETWEAVGQWGYCLTFAQACKSQDVLHGTLEADETRVRGQNGEADLFDALAGYQEQRVKLLEEIYGGDDGAFENAMGTIAAMLTVLPRQWSDFVNKGKNKKRLAVDFTLETKRERLASGETKVTLYWNTDTASPLPDPQFYLINEDGTGTAFQRAEGVNGRAGNAGSGLQYCLTGRVLEWMTLRAVFFGLSVYSELSANCRLMVRRNEQILAGRINPRFLYETPWQEFDSRISCYHCINSLPALTVRGAGITGQFEQALRLVFEEKLKLTDRASVTASVAYGYQLESGIRCRIPVLLICREECGHSLWEKTASRLCEWFDAVSPRTENVSLYLDVNIYTDPGQTGDPVLAASIKQIEIKLEESENECRKSD